MYDELILTKESKNPHVLLELTKMPFTGEELIIVSVRVENAHMCAIALFLKRVML